MLLKPLPLESRGPSGVSSPSVMTISVYTSGFKPFISRQSVNYVYKLNPSLLVMKLYMIIFMSFTSPKCVVNESGS